MRGDNDYCRRRIRKTVREFEQLVIDCNAWNGLHPEHQPIDCETDRVSLKIAREAQAAIDADDRRDFEAKLKELIAYGDSLEGQE